MAPQPCEFVGNRDIRISQREMISVLWPTRLRLGYSGHPIDAYETPSSNVDNMLRLSIMSGYSPLEFSVAIGKCNFVC